MTWSTVLEPPPQLADAGAADAWFTRIATQLLGSCRLNVAGSLHRLVEIEFYFHSPHHPDPFAHCDPRQATRGRWYFHRVGPSYRGGSFKGVDLTFGGGDAFGGILVRSLEAPDGQIVVGPSLCVDHLLSTTRHASVAELDGSIADRTATDVDSPLHLIADSDADVTLFRSARVGLSLKRFNDALAVDRLARSYRFLTDPRRVTKGRTELIDALLAEGRSCEDIRRLTGSPIKTIAARAAAATSGTVAP